MTRRCIRSTCAVLIGAALALQGAPAASATEGRPFGIAKFTLQATRTVERDEGPARIVENIPATSTQASSHLNGEDGGPDSLTTTIRFATEEFGSDGIAPTRDPKNVIVTLPAGLLGDPVAVPRCSLTKLLDGARCPADTQVGVDVISFGGTKEPPEIGPIVNVTPEAGQSAEFALENPQKIPFLETGHLVRTEQGYAFTVVGQDVPVVGLREVQQTFWGVPGDPRHDPERGLLCEKFCSLEVVEKKQAGGGGEKFGLEPVPFLTLPTSCASGPESATIRADSWEEPGKVLDNQKYIGFVERVAEEPLPTVIGGTSLGFTGCELLKFEPGLTVRPDTTVADAPVGLGVGIQVPQPEEPAVLSTPHLRDAVITLPLGMSVSPGVVDGVQACESQGPEGINITGPESEEVGLNGELQLAPGHCPNASTVGTAEAVTPLLAEPVKGHVYLARPRCGGSGQAPCTKADALDGNLYRLYLELGGAGPLAKTGIDIKVEGQVDVDPATGQITTKFLDNPQTPFSELVVHLNGGPRASLDNPIVCGTAMSTSDFTPWSAPGRTPQGLLVAGTADATPSSSYQVQGCSSPTPFSPGFVAGTVTPQAGQFSSFTMNLARQDREQFVKGIQIHTPPGLTGLLSSVPLCGEAQADAGTCPAASKIGTTRVASGAGSHPFEIEGSVYLTGPYGGAPFGLSVVTDAIAGPFNLGLVVVRARISVDPTTSELTVTTDETGPYALPQLLDGVPLRLKLITVNIDRAGFMINPTNCGDEQIEATISGSGQAVAHLSSPFAVGGCKSLSFKPQFKVSTSGKTSRARGASLDARLSYPAGSLGNAANIARVKVTLPKQLPSYLHTLQQACLASTFETNPAVCPAGSVVGIVKAFTPLLPVGLSGPVYFVSHGGEEFPSLVVVLQGYGVRVDLTGSTFIKRGVTSSTFKTIPDVPVNTFELYLPEGVNHALAANGNLCKAAKLTMPTEFVAQNGAVLRQNTKIAVSGCARRITKGRRGR